MTTLLSEHYYSLLGAGEGRTIIVSGIWDLSVMVVDLFMWIYLLEG